MKPMKVGITHAAVARRHGSIECEMFLRCEECRDEIAALCAYDAVNDPFVAALRWAVKSGWVINDDGTLVCRRCKVRAPESPAPNVGKRSRFSRSRDVTQPQEETEDGASN